MITSFYYVGIRSTVDSFDTHIEVITIVNKERPIISPLKHIVYHSPTGMEWGYGGSGPADTALSILTDYFQRTRSIPEKPARQLAEGYYQRFKWTFMASAPREGFVITESQITDWIEKLNPESLMGYDIGE